MVKRVLVVECVPKYNWYSIFQDSILTSGEAIEVEQATWREVNLTAYSDSGLVVNLAPAAQPHPDTKQNTERTFRPDFILFRSLCQHIGNLDDKNKLYAIHFANIPTMNSTQSIYGMLEKPWVYGELKKIEKRLGTEHFPLVEQTYYPSHKSMVISPGFPCVVKIGPYHAGYGKMKVESQDRFSDVRSIVALNKDYCTAEMFIEWDYEIRIQKIGPSVKCFKRTSMNWKGNVGNMSRIEDAEVSDDFAKMIEAASGIFGGMDICALDLVHNVKTDRFEILELNGTAIGLVKDHAMEDMRMMRDVVLGKMNRLFREEAEERKESEERQEKEEEKEVMDGNGSDDKAYVEAIRALQTLKKENDTLKKTQQKKGNDCVVM